MKWSTHSGRQPGWQTGQAGFGNCRQRGEEYGRGPASGLEEQRARKPFPWEVGALGVLPTTLHPVGKAVWRDSREAVASHPVSQSKQAKEGRREKTSSNTQMHQELPGFLGQKNDSGWSRSLNPKRDGYSSLALHGDTYTSSQKNMRSEELSSCLIFTLFQRRF